MDEDDAKRLRELETQSVQGREKQKKQVEKLLSSVSDLLLLFSGDGRLTYPVDETGEQFALDPKRRTVTVPLSFFTGLSFHETDLLFHLYTALALYPDYEKNPDGYLSRAQTFQREEEVLTGKFLQRARECGAEKDAAYQEDVVFAFMTNEILSFLEDCDLYASMLLVMEKAPVYKEPTVRKELAKILLLEDSLPKETDQTATHRDLAGLLVTREFWGEEEIENGRIREMFREEVLGKPRFLLLREELLACMLRSAPVTARDAVIRTILLPCFMKLFFEDIDRMELSSTVSLREQEKERDEKRKKRGAQTKANYEEMLKDLDEEKRQRAVAAKELLTGKPNLSFFGVTPEDQRLFDHYEALVRPEREQMKAYWKKLLGDTSKEISVRIEGAPKGTLAVQSLIDQYPAFTEAQRRQNYRGLSIFHTWELKKISRVLPRYLDITFVMDSSGSMRGGKLAPARQALAIVLLSLEDFAVYLAENAARTQEVCEVRTEVWLFGTKAKKVLSFSDRGEKRKADRILSIARLDGSLGSTDDGACLMQAAKEETPQMIREQKAGKRIRMLFEVTDGASSFPGTAKKAVEELQRDQVLLQAIGIGDPKDTAARASFDYVFGDNGLFLGDDISRLPEALLSAVREGVGGVLKGYFRRGSAGEPLP